MIYTLAVPGGNWIFSQALVGTSSILMTHNRKIMCLYQMCVLSENRALMKENTSGRIIFPANYDFCY